MRTVRRYPGGAVVSVRIKNRDLTDIAADMVEGVLVVNRLEGDAAANLRPLLAEAARPDDRAAAA